jgi:endonuclease YncB( thermonuclease family)
LNHKRRIFRSSMGLASALPSVGMLLAAGGGAATLLIAASLFVRSSNAPALVRENSHIFARADQLAVLDGNTVRVGDQVIRLEGIVAPARGEICHAADRSEVDCGSAAANALAALVRGRAVDCTIHGHDRQGRPFGACLAAGRPLSAALVEDGWARASAAELQEAEATARAAGRGVWRGGV